MKLSNIVAGATLLASSVLADVDPIVIKVCLQLKEIYIANTNFSGLQILLQEQRHSIVWLIAEFSLVVYTN